MQQKFEILPEEKSVSAEFLNQLRQFFKKSAAVLLIFLFVFTPLNFTFAAPYNDYLFKDQYYLDSVHAKEAWNIQPSASAVIVAIIDDGVYELHDELRNLLWVNQKEKNNNIDDDKNGYVDDFKGWDFLSKNGDMGIRGTHGTAVAGILGAMPNNGIGIAGITRGVQIMPLILCQNGQGCSSAVLPEAIRYAVDNGANIINMSIGGQYSDDINEAIEYAYKKNVVIIAAAGNIDNETNFGQDLNAHARSPVCNDNGQDMVLGVSAVSKEHKKLDWAAFGKCVDVVAPGEDIVATSLAQLVDKETAMSSGTSFAAPIVTAGAALLKARYPTMTNRQIIDTLKQTADHNPDYKGELGSGMINIYKALTEPVFISQPSNAAGLINIKKHPYGTVILGSDNKTVYVIGNNVKRGFATPEEYNSQGFVFSDIIKAMPEDLSLPDGEIMRFADGTLVLDTTDNRTVYMVDAGTKRGFASEEVFTKLGYSFAQAVKGNLSQYGTGEPIISQYLPHPAGAVIKNGMFYYKVAAGGKQRIFSQGVLDSWHWTQDKIVVANEADIKLPEIGTFPYRDGTLLKAKSGAIYVVSKGELCPISSMDVFNKLNYSVSKIISLPENDFYLYKVGPVI